MSHGTVPVLRCGILDDSEPTRFHFGVKASRAVTNRFRAIAALLTAFLMVACGGEPQDAGSLLHRGNGVEPESLDMHRSRSVEAGNVQRDIGEGLGVGAHLTGLRRTAIGAWSVDDAVRMDELGDAALVKRRARSPLDALDHLPRLDVGEEVAGRLSMGQSVRLELIGEAGALQADEAGQARSPVAVAHSGALLAVGEAADGVLRPRKVFSA